MREIDYNLENELKKGNFECLDLDYWFKTYQYNYIISAIQGCDKVINRDVLNFIVTYAELLLLYPNKDIELNNNDIISNCEYLLSQAIIVGSKHFGEYRDIVLPLFHSTNDTVRLYCHANLPLHNSWLMQESFDRIQKIRYLRSEFYHCWDEDLFTNITKDRILYLVKALELRVINCTFNNYDLEYTGTAISSLLFESGIYIPEFDIDVLHTIQDKRILGYCLNKLIEDGYLKFKDGIRLPNCLTVDNSSTCMNKIKMKRLEAINVFDKMYRVKK